MSNLAMGYQYYNGDQYYDAPVSPGYSSDGYHMYQPCSFYTPDNLVLAAPLDPQGEQQLVQTPIHEFPQDEAFAPASICATSQGSSSTALADAHDAGACSSVQAYYPRRRPSYSLKSAQDSVTQVPLVQSSEYRAVIARYSDNFLANASSSLFGASTSRSGNTTASAMRRSTPMRTSELIPARKRPWEAMKEEARASANAHDAGACSSVQAYYPVGRPSYSVSQAQDSVTQVPLVQSSEYRATIARCSNDFFANELSSLLEALKSRSGNTTASTMHRSTSMRTSGLIPARKRPSEGMEGEAQGLSDASQMLDLTKHITKVGNNAMARGGFGEIWKCIYSTDQGLIQVAVKSLPIYMLDQHNGAIEKKAKRIWRELGICTRLKHPNIIAVYGYTLGFGELVAIVSHWAENGDLTTYLKRHETDTILTPLRRLEILRDIAAGLEYLHANKVVHGDLTGRNVLIHGNGIACLTDFGLSLIYSEEISISLASCSSQFHGTIRWLDPELLGHADDTSPVKRAAHNDMYSFGGIVLQVITGEIPYHYLGNVAQVILNVSKRVKPLRTRYPPVSDKH